MALGYLSLVLHAHLPFVRHPEYDDFLEEDWLYEAITETYIPLLDAFSALDRDGIDWRLTMSVSPTLAAMLCDELLQSRYIRHLDNLIALAEKELVRTRFLPDFYPLAQMYHERFLHCRKVFSETYQRNLLTGFKHFFDTGRLELMTCAATHGFLPLMVENDNARRAQIELGCREFARHFGRRPLGIWLPECGYAPPPVFGNGATGASTLGVDELLRDSGIQYFFTDTHGVLHAEPRPRFGVYAPILCPKSGVLVLGRDTESSKQVWSAVEGYPGDPDYRDFYRDVGFDLDYDYLKPHLHQMGIRTLLGMKYHRITGPTEEKLPYVRANAMAKVESHAANFLFNRVKQSEWLAGSMDGRPPLIVAPYDAELFGHWWFEGPEWIEQVLRKMGNEYASIRPITVPEYLTRHPRIQKAQPSMSSWGYKGYCEVWLEGSNDWLYRHLHELGHRMVELARKYPETEGIKHRAITQAARELLLAQASDWAFIMKTGTMVEYARERTRLHVSNFHHLYDAITTDAIDEARLAEMEQRHNLFPALDYRLWA
jgi:1,4-alpha-glucan branching enzyme